MRLLIVLLILTGCTTVELKDIPVYHKARIQGEVFCYAEVRFVSGKARCVSEEEFIKEIEPTAIILSAGGFFYFRDLALKMCAYANKNEKLKCTHDVKSFEKAVEVLWNFTNTIGEL